VQRAKLEVQKQNKVKIVEKLLNEEKALATHKKLQPHLYVDRHKELVKVITVLLCPAPNRRGH